MTTYSINDADLGKVKYRDNKRYLWILSVFLPVFPLLGVLLYFYTGSEWTLGIPLLFSYLCIPVLDGLFGSDTNNPPEAIVPLLEQDRYYRLQSYAISVILQGGLILVFGWIMLPFLAIHNFWAWFQLTSANYIEHYGLLRQKLPSGAYERCQPHHSWNANYVFSNVVLFQLERHSDHHANSSRRYQSLRNFDDIPELPNGYFGMYLLASIPWLWYWVMDKRLLALPHIQGDLSLVNIQPSRRGAIVARYGV